MLNDKLSPKFYMPATGSQGSKEQQLWLMRKRIENFQSK